ncbi:MAG: putative cytokinetic ring protein SteA [Acidimicrobiia bacterium]
MGLRSRRLRRRPGGGDHEGRPAHQGPHPRLQSGEIAIIKHRDLDRVATDSLIEKGAAAVVNCDESVSGRYPNGGPIRVVNAGIPLLDRVDPEVMDLVQEGDVLTIEGDEIRRNGELLATGHPMTAPEIEAAMDAARATIGAEVERFAENTLEYVRREAKVFFEPLQLPPIHTKFEGRHALVVVRGHDYREDLLHLKAYIREYRPVLIGVDGGGDALLELGFTPDIIIGDFDSVSQKGLHCGAELVHHVHPDGRAPGRENLLEWGVDYVEFVVDGTSEDVAMLLAYESGAQLIVAVGTHATLVEFLDKGRPGMASTFLTRLRLGPVLVDAKGVSRLYEGRVRRLDIVLLVSAALIAMLVVAIVAEPIHVFARGLWVTLKDIFGG